MIEPHRPALRYFGAKWRDAPRIIAHFPPHECYVEPFAGGAAVLLRKPPSPLEYYNDSSGDVVNYFRVLRDRTDDLLLAIRRTPFSREELALSLEPAADPVERARRFYVRMWQGRGAHESATGWRYQRRRARNKTALGDWTDLSHLPAAAERFTQVGIEHDDALAVIRRFDAETTLFYVDPPYLREVRSKTSPRYAEEFSTEHDHRMLAAVLGEIEGMAVLSGKPSGLYEDLFESRGWRRIDRASRDAEKSTTESIWLNPACAAAQLQGRLFEAVVD